jgi:hypothetical protein
MAVALGAFVACLSYLNWSAERKATKFCDAIEIGSDISVAIGKAKYKQVFCFAFEDKLAKLIGTRAKLWLSHAERCVPT